MQQIFPFGITASGEQAECLILDNGTLRCQILTFGATLQSLWVPDREGRPVDVVLGYDTLREYETRDGYLGATVGRCANRIAHGRFCLNGREYRLAVNNGPNHLHGGNVGFSHRIWTVEELSDSHAALCLDSPDGEEGYPGHLRLRVCYRLRGKTLELHYWAVTDRDTPCNLTNHSYFNLAGHASGPVFDQRLCIQADAYTPVDETAIPLGTLAPVAGTPLDLREPVRIGAHVDAPFPQLRLAGGYDHNYVLRGASGALRLAAQAVSPATGIGMRVDTTLPGLQLYTANYIEEGRPGKGGAHYGPRHAFCLETQFYPDSPNQPEFPSAILRAGAVYDHTTCFSFDAPAAR